MRPTDRSYLDSHEWAKIDGDIVTVGITDFAIEQLGELVFLELPENGQTVSKGVAFGEVESVKAVSDLISPVSGEIIEVHNALCEELNPLQSNPHEEGWLLKIKATDTSELDSLKDAAAYEELVASAS
jgi:glycine cleavage system H protein